MRNCYSKFYYFILLFMHIVGGTDFSIPQQPYNLVISAGLSKTCVNISLTDDSVLEQNETFTIEIEAMDSRIILDASQSTATVTIVDDDSMFV